MASQNLVFVLLPNGILPAKTLSLSVYLTPRLQSGNTLAAFPDFLDWAGLVKDHGLTLTFGCAGKTHAVPVTQGILRSDVWQEIFKKDTYVEPYKIPDFDQRLIVSYPVREATSFLKYAYQAVGSGSFLGQQERGGLAHLLRDLVFRDGDKSNLASEISSKRLDMWKEQRGNLSEGVANKAPGKVGVLELPAFAAVVPPDGVPAPLTPPANAHDTMTRFAMYHHMPPAPNRPPLPQTEADFKKTLDFHRALTSLNSYPSLMRSLGLVFDVELPGDFCPASPSAGLYGTIELLKVTLGVKWKLAPQFTFPSTSYVRDKKDFRAAPATSAAGVTGSQYVPTDVVSGFLALTPDNFHLLEVDLDGGLLKALGLADNATNARDQSKVGDNLPSLRSSGIGLVADARGAQLLQSISDNKGFDQAATSSATFPRALNGRDLLRGFRIDIWTSTTQEWRSLHFRNSTYRFGPSSEIEIQEPREEGFLQPTATQPADDPTRKPDPAATAAGVPQPGTDIYAHERIARWEGWSLSTKRPGLALNSSPDPGLATTPDPTIGQPLTPFKMTTDFAVFPGSLPQLRFGTNYRLRARAVDLAGNSVSLQAPTLAEFALPAGQTQLPYLRFEPVLPPLLVLQQPTAVGATLERMVIRSLNNTVELDAVATGDTDHRHVGPPRAGESIAEQHGMFDGSNGKLLGDPTTFSNISARDGYEIPTQGDVPLEPSANLNVGYLPDPIARGAAFRNLPNTPDNTSGRVGSGGLSYSVLPDVQPRAGSVTYIDFGTAWPERQAFLLTMQEGKASPAWDIGNRVLTLSLPKGALTTVDLSSYISESDLLLMGIWAWLREYFEARELAAMQGGAAEFAVGATSDFVALLTRLILEGGHDMITPARTLTLVHAVQQPLGIPEFVQLPVVHRPTNPIFASTLRNSFTPITAWRSHGSHNAVLLGALKINGNSTSKIDLEARWKEYTDDPAKAGPTTAWNSAHVENIPLSTTDGGEIFSDGTNTRMVGVYIPSVDTCWFSAPFDELDGVVTPGDVAAPVHRFDDTKHRWVGYTAIANSRFEEYFPPGLDFTRSSDTLLVDVPSSARPLAPDIAYVVPTFGWEQQETTNVKSTVRFGNGVRVYLNRPWYSSGDSELLGVILWNGAAPDYPTRELFKPFFTQWGNDPIWKTGFLSNVPSVGDFPNAFDTATALAIEENPRPFDVAGHTVQFDPKRRLWFCDIQFSNSLSYMPFVRLALGRYQPHSIAGVELSRIVLADYVQLTADRSAVISIDPSDTRKAKVFVGGVAPQPPAQSVIEVTVQRRMANVVSDLAWEVAPANVVTVTEDSPAPTEPDAVLWSGSVLFAKTPPHDEFRIVIREFERIQIDGPPTVAAVLGERMVYVAIVDYAVPAR
jgi:hypothetical protein